MKSLIEVCMIIASLVLVEGHQRVAPGVPPQQYQQQQYVPLPPSPNQMQPPQQQIPNQVPQMQQQVQYQQVPVQQQQIPQQQQQHVPVQQQVPVQGVPQQGGHPQGGHAQGGHGHGHGQQQLLNTANIMQEKQHIQEHIDIPMDISKMTEQELQFHYFKMHDADRNDKLDGCELIKSLIHWHGESHSASGEEGPKLHTDEELESLVDSILNQLDKNKDGFVDYIEYKSANE